MQRLLAALLILVTGGLARAETFELPGRGKLQVFFVGDWNVKTEDVGEMRVSVRPKDLKVNAEASFLLSTDDREEFQTPEKLAAYLQVVAERLIASGRVGRQKIKVEPVYSRQGHGFGFTLRDPKLAGRRSVPGDYKLVTAGIVRLTPGVVMDYNIFADSTTAESYQQLLGALEGAEFRANR
jgi:hypothetical protein